VKARIIFRPFFVFISFACLFIFFLTGRVEAQNQSIIHYRLIDLGTFGGPNSSEAIVSPYINDQGLVVGFADTSTPDPFNPEGFIPHPFRWQKGTLSDLGTLSGGKGGFAIFSNSLGQITGVSDNGQVDPQLGGPEGMAVVWEKGGRIIDLGTLGGTQSLAGGINNHGQVIGVAANTIPDPISLFGWATQTRAALWDSNGIHDLGTLGGPDAATSYINNVGQVSGISYVDTASSSPCPFDFPFKTRGFLWENGKMIDLGTLGGSCSGTVKINNRGQIAGSSTLPFDQPDHPFLWENGRMRDLGTLGGSFGLANSLNESGDVAGTSSPAGDESVHAFFWRNGRMTDLGTVPGDSCSIAHSLNNGGRVVGTSLDCANFGVELHGFLWWPGSRLVDLNEFVPPGSDLQITDGESINDAGEIAGTGMLLNGDFHAIVLVPCQNTVDTNCRAVDPSVDLPMPAQQTTAQKAANYRAVRALMHTTGIASLFATPSWLHTAHSNSRR
jgi:probable HAF family extracellular repeat protein